MNSTSPARTLTVYSADSLRSAYPRVNSLTVRFSSSDTTVMRVLDTVATIAPRASSVSTARVIPGGAGGTAWIRASAGGHLTDSVQFTVLPPALALSFQTMLIGAGQTTSQRYVYIPNAVGTPVVVTLTSSDSSKVAVPTTVTIPANTGHVYFPLRGIAPGGATLIASAPGYAPDTATVTATTPRVRIAQGSLSLINYSSRFIQVYTGDSINSTVHNRIANLAVTLRTSDTTVLKIDSTAATVLAGNYYSQSVQIRAVGVGSAWIVATAPGHFPDSVRWTVDPAKLNFSWVNDVIGARQTFGTNDQYVMVPSNPSTPVTVTLTQKRPSVTSLSASTLTIPTNIHYQFFTVSALALGRDTIIATATGYLPDTAFITVSTPRIRVDAGSGTATTTSPPRTLAVYSADSLNRVRTTNDTLVVRAVSSDTNVIRPGQAFFRIPKGSYYFNPTMVFVGVGTASITYSDSAGSGYLPATTNAVTVTGPALQIYQGHTMIGMRQKTVNNFYIYTPNAVTTPLTVNLVSTGPRVATVPASVTIPAGNSYVYFDITAQDTVGTIQIQASATGYTPTSVNMQVTVPRFRISTNSSRYTTSGPSQLTVYATDANGSTHYVTENVTVTLMTSAPGVATIDSTTVVIPAGSYLSTAALWSPRVAGTAKLITSDSRTARYAYLPDTVTVSVLTPPVTSFTTMQLGIGQYSDEYVYVPDNVRDSLVVPIGHSSTPRTTTPASVTIPAQRYYQLYRITGTSAGVDTLTFSPAGHIPGRGIVTVGKGSIVVSGWRTSLAVGDSALVTLYTADPQGSTRYTAAATVFTLAPNSAVEFRSGGASSAAITAVTVAANTTYVQFYIKGVSAGGATATISNTNYNSYSNTLTVNP